MNVLTQTVMYSVSHSYLHTDIHISDSDVRTNEGLVIYGGDSLLL